MARLRPISLYPLSFEDALRGLLAVGPAPSKATPAKAHQKRQTTTTRKTKSASATKKKRKKK